MTDQNADLTPESGEGNPVEAARPEWLPSNFDSPEAFVKSHKELERSFHETRTELRAQQERFENFLSEQEARQQQAQQAQSQNNTLDAWDQAIVSAYEEGDYARARHLERQLEDARMQALAQTLQQAQQAQPQAHDPLLGDVVVDQAMSSAHADWPDYKERALSWAKEQMPNYNNLPPSERANLAEIAYRYVLADDLPNIIARQQTDLTAQKMQAQTASGAGVRQPATPSDQEEWAKIKAAAKQMPGQYW